MAEHVDLGYAITAHRAQGVTVDTAHVVVTEATTRENLYVAMTRGREQNHAYVITHEADEDHGAPDAQDAPTAKEVLTGVLANSGAELSATQKSTLFKSLIGKAQDGGEANLIDVLANNERLSALPEIAGLFEELRAAQEGVKEATIYSAFPVDDAQLKALIEAAINFLKGGETPQQRLDNAMEAAQSAVNALSGSSVGRAVLTPLLAGIKLRYGLKRLDASVESNLWMLEGEINPVKKVPTAKTETGTGVGVTEPTSVEYGSMRTISDSATGTSLEVGTRMTATVLGPDYFSNGSPTNDTVRGELRAQIGAARQNKYRIGHLLNNHLGGKGTDWHNLTPLSSSGNATHLHSIEKAVKNHVTGKQQAFYEVRVNYGGGGPGNLPATAHPLEKQFASELQARWCELIPDPKKPGKLMKKDPSPSWIPIPNSF
mgnify:CR=1 FL=1